MMCMLARGTVHCSSLYTIYSQLRAKDYGRASRLDKISLRHHLRGHNIAPCENLSGCIVCLAISQFHNFCDGAWSPWVVGSALLQRARLEKL